jgi:hypothetical protein
MVIVDVGGVIAEQFVVSIITVVVACSKLSSSKLKLIVLL